MCIVINPLGADISISFSIMPLPVVSLSYCVAFSFVYVIIILSFLLDASFDNVISKSSCKYNCVASVSEWAVCSPFKFISKILFVLSYFEFTLNSSAYNGVAPFIVTFSTDDGNFTLIVGFLYKSYCTPLVINFTPNTTFLFTVIVDNVSLFTVNSAFDTVSFTSILDSLEFSTSVCSTLFILLVPFTVFLICNVLALLSCSIVYVFSAVAFVWLISNIPVFSGLLVVISISLTGVS